MSPTYCLHHSTSSPPHSTQPTNDPRMPPDLVFDVHSLQELDEGAWGLVVAGEGDERQAIEVDGSWVRPAGTDQGER